MLLKFWLMWLLMFLWCIVVVGLRFWFNVELFLVVDLRDVGFLCWCGLVLLGVVGEIMEVIFMLLIDGEIKGCGILEVIGEGVLLVVEW